MALNDDVFKCPVCRARQERQSECRRCHADLTLVVAIRNHIDSLAAQIQKAHGQGDSCSALERELELLDPTRLSAIAR